VGGLMLKETLDQTKGLGDAGLSWSPTLVGVGVGAGAGAGALAH